MVALRTIRLEREYWSHPALTMLSSHDFVKQGHFRLSHLLGDLRICYLEGDMDFIGDFYIDVEL